MGECARILAGALYKYRRAQLQRGVVPSLIWRARHNANRTHSPNTIPRKHAFSVLSVRECDLRAASRVLHAAASENGATGARSNLSAALIKLIHLLSTVNTMRSRKPRTLHNNILASRVYYFRAERHRCGGWVF